VTSTLWFLLEFTVLLALAAGVFAWLGWTWRGSDQGERLKKLHEQLEDERRSARAASAGLEEQLSSLRGQLTSAITEAESARTSLEASRAELAALRQKLAEAPGQPPPAPAPPTARLAGETPAPSPARKVEKATPKPRAAKKKPASAAPNVQEKLAWIESALTPALSTLTALTQEREDWQRRITQLESKTPADPADLGLARRGLAGSMERLSKAQATVDSLQNQLRVLQKTLQQAAGLASLPDDDLTKIKGIKGVISDKLHALGIRTWRQIAEWNDDDLRAFSELLAFKNRASRDHWQEQARLLARQ